MSALFGLTGILAFLICTVLLIVNLIKRKPKRLFLFGMLGGFILFIMGIVMPSPPEVAKTPTLITENPIEISASSLYAEYKNNEIAAEKKFESKTLKVTGVVSSIGREIAGRAYVVLNNGGQYDMWGVQCLFPASYEEAIAKLNKGDTINVTGKCTGFLVNVILEVK